MLTLEISTKKRTGNVYDSKKLSYSGRAYHANWFIVGDAGCCSASRSTGFSIRAPLLRAAAQNYRWRSLESLRMAAAARLWPGLHLLLSTLFGFCPCLLDERRLNSRHLDRCEKFKKPVAAQEQKHSQSRGKGKQKYKRQPCPVAIAAACHAHILRRPALGERPAKKDCRQDSNGKTARN